MTGCGQHVVNCKEGHCTQAAVFVKRDVPFKSAVDFVKGEYELKSQISYPTIPITRRTGPEIVDILKEATENSLCAATPIRGEIYSLDDLWQYYRLRESVETFEQCGSLLEECGRAVRLQRKIYGEWESLAEIHGAMRPYYEVDLS